VANGHRERNIGFMKEYLSDKACLHCGESDPIVLEFNHIDPASKRNTVSDMVRKGISIATLMAEIEKCEILCANCHRRHTTKQFGYHRGKW
jgi:5-methylcytosine-specific restriction endonuclease McrA